MMAAHEKAKKSRFGVRGLIRKNYRFDEALRMNQSQPQKQVKWER